MEAHHGAMEAHRRAMEALVAQRAPPTVVILIDFLSLIPISQKLKYIQAPIPQIFPGTGR
jgi:hypothetical protein